MLIVKGASAPVQASCDLRKPKCYQQAAHFWLIQTIESLIFLGLAGLLICTAVTAVRRHRAS
jgi:hypothetical protein